jgi:hypothetical protein
MEIGATGILFAPPKIRMEEMIRSKEPLLQRCPADPAA